MAAAPRIQAMPEANAAYQAALAALQNAHANLDSITNDVPVDWDAYNAGVASCTSCQNTAQSALSAFQAAILNTPTVQDLIGKLRADTQAMNKAAADLDKTAAKFTTLSSVANSVTSILTTILKFL